MGWVEKRRTKSGKVRWRGGYRRPDGSKAGRTFDLEREAREWIAVNEGRIASGRFRDERDQGELLADFWPHALAVLQLKPKPAGDYESVGRKWVIPRLGSRRLGELQRRDLSDFHAGMLADGASAHTANKVYRYLRSVLSVAVAEEVLQVNPAFGLKLRSPDREEVAAVPEADVWRLAGLVSPRYRALVLTLAYTGLRIGEASALRSRHHDPVRGRLRIEGSVVDVGGRMVEQASTKTGKSRTVPLAAPVNLELIEHLAEHGAPEDPSALVFTSARGGFVRPGSFLNDELKPAAARLGLPPIKTHHLRHTAVAIAIGNGWDVLSVQRMLGHSSSQVTLDVYGHLFEGHREDLLAATVTGIERARELAARDGNVVELRRR